MTSPKKDSLLILFIGLILTITSFVFGRASNKITVSNYTESRFQGNYKFINPLLECDSANFSQNTPLESLKKQLIQTINQLEQSKQINFASVYVRNLNNGPWVGVNETTNFSPASLVKVPLMMAYFKEAEKNPGILQKTISIGATYRSNQTILPEITLAPNQTYTIEELINRMIIYSDNQAYELLQDFIDNKLIVQTYTDLGVDISQAYNDPNGNILSVRAYASFFRILFNASYLNKDMSEKALNLLSQVKYANGLVKGINDPKIIVSHKFGERTYEDTGEKQLHDCGIVYIPQNPYLICIMTRGSDFSKLSTSVVKLSDLIYHSIP